MRLMVLAMGLAYLVAGQVWAGAPPSSMRPLPRPQAAAQLNAVSTMGSPVPVVVREQPMASSLLRSSLRPAARPLAPKTLVTASARTQPSTFLGTGKKGALCGDPAIKGQTLGPIAGRIRGCGVADAVKVTSVDGVALSTPATMDCATAQALKTWVVKGAKPAVGEAGGGIKSLTVAGSYVCRSRNNQNGEKISEHGRGKAIDIGAITLVNGTSITVLKGWNDHSQGKILKKMHKAACGPFGTVLGPSADAYHRDHFHFDTSRHRNGTYCR